MVFATLSAFQSDSLWILIVGFIVAFVLLCANGANDTASAFGTSVGAKVLKLWHAYILAMIFETLGAALAGHEVTDTMRKDVVDLAEFNQTEKELMLGQVSALASTGIWLLLATILRLPVSSTQSTMGSTLGYSLVSRGFGAVQWEKIGMIVGSWFISPLLSGAFSSLFYWIIAHTVLLKEDPLTSGLRLLPVFYFVTVVVGLFSITFEGPSALSFDKIPVWGVVIITLGGGLLVAIIVKVFLISQLRKWITKTAVISSTNDENVDACSHEAVDGPNTDNAVNPSDVVIYVKPTGNPPMSGVPNNAKQPSMPLSCAKLFLSKVPSLRVDVKENAYATRLFSFLQVLSSCFGLFAHGANDLSNAIAPLVSLWLVYQSGSYLQAGESPIWIRFYGVFAVSVGLWALGHRVIYTVGEGLTKISPASGFAIEIGSAFTVLVASKIGLPISTTYCKVSSVVCVGWLNYENSVNWKTFRNIVISWVITVPFTALVSAFLMWILHFAL